MDTEQNCHRPSATQSTASTAHRHCLNGRVNINPKENDLPLPFAPTNICLLGCLDGVINVDERGRAGPTTNLLQFATF
jgi:hypothetical protein